MTQCQTLIQALRQNGYRITPQREMVIEALAHASHHITAEEVYERVRARSRAVNRATVYRTLDVLIGQGLASRVNLGGAVVVYATRQHGSHIHLVCRQCLQWIEADPELLASLGLQLQNHYRFAVDFQHLCLPGLCQSCQSTKGAEES